MDNYLVINGKRIDLTPEQLETLGIVEKPEDVFERASEGETYYCISACGDIERQTDFRCEYDNCCYDTSNYCLDAKILRHRSHFEVLNRLLWRYSMQHGGDKIDWCSGQGLYYLVHNHEENEWLVRFIGGPVERFGCVYFVNKEVAEEAIRKIVLPYLSENPNFKM